MNGTRRISTIPLLLPALLLLAIPAHAQTGTPELVDRVVAVVGDSVVLKSELEEDLITHFASRGQMPPQDSAVVNPLLRQLLDNRVSELLFVQAALRDTTIKVSDDEVQRQVDAEIAQRQRAMGGELAFTRALAQQRMTVAEYRDIIARGVRRDMLVQQYIGLLRRDRRPPPVTEDEVREFFEAQKGMLGRRPATLVFEQVVVAPRASDSARAAAHQRALDVLKELRAGGDFELLARRYSEDPSNREQGGSLGWFRRGDMVPQFDSAAFSLRPGELSGIVESSYGLHIIRVDRVRGAERQARHILIRPELTDADIERAAQLAEQIAERVREGEPVAALAEQYGDPDERVRVEATRDRLPPPYDTELADAPAGAVVGPFRVPGAPSEKWAVVKVVEVTPEGEYSLDDPRVHAQVRQQLEHQKLLDEVLGELRRRMHVEVRF